MPQPAPLHEAIPVLVPPVTSPQYAATMASTSTRGCPEVPLTTMLTFRLTAVDQLSVVSTRLQDVVVA